MKAISFTLTIAALFACSTAACQGQIPGAGDRTDDSLQQIIWPDATNPDRNALYVNLSTIIFAWVGTINYERGISDFLSIRGGYGASIWMDGGEYGPLLAGVIHGSERSTFEFGMGIAYMHEEQHGPTPSKGWQIQGVATIGYRYRSRGGFFIRTGAGLEGSAGGVYVGLGASF